MTADNTCPGEQMLLPGIDATPSRPAREVLRRLQTRLEKCAHRAPCGEGNGSPRVYAFAGSMKQMKQCPDKLPHCPAFYATQDVFGHVAPQLSGDAIAQWRLHGEEIPQPGDLFYVFSLPHQDWIGAGAVYREGDAIMAFLERGSYPDFARFEHDAGGLILVFQTGGILR